MATTNAFRPSDLLGLGRLGIQGFLGITGLVESMHERIGGTGAISELVYQSIRGTAGLVRQGVDLLAPAVPVPSEEITTPEREAGLAILNGIVGDHLAETGNPLAIPMRPRAAGSGPKLLVLAHGLCLNHLQWNRKGHDHGAALARDLGYAPVYLHYNTGLHVSTNGRALSGLLEALLDEWPSSVDELAIIGHSMGGLVARSAYHYGVASGFEWPRRLRKLVFLGTPHHGSPVERVGNWINVLLEQSPYSAPFARLGKTRSAGITDLRYGNLLDEDWAGRDRFAPGGDARTPVGLPRGVECYAIAARVRKLLGDGLVPIGSALGRHREAARDLRLPEARQWVAEDVSHLELLSDQSVYDQILQWMRPVALLS